MYYVGDMFQTRTTYTGNVDFGKTITISCNRNCIKAYVQYIVDKETT